MRKFQSLTKRVSGRIETFSMSAFYFSYCICQSVGPFFPIWPLLLPFAPFGHVWLCFGPILASFSHILSSFTHLRIGMYKFFRLFQIGFGNSFNELKRVSTSFTSLSCTLLLPLYVIFK